MERANLGAQIASVAQCRVDKSLTARTRARPFQVRVEADARASDFGDAFLAARAAVGVDNHGLIWLDKLDASAILVVPSEY